MAYCSLLCKPSCTISVGILKSLLSFETLLHMYYNNIIQAYITIHKFLRTFKFRFPVNVNDMIKKRCNKHSSVLLIVFCNYHSLIKCVCFSQRLQLVVIKIRRIEDGKRRMKHITGRKCRPTSIVQSKTDEIEIYCLKNSVKNIFRYLKKLLHTLLDNGIFQNISVVQSLVRQYLTFNNI